MALNATAVPASPASAAVAHLKYPFPDKFTFYEEPTTSALAPEGRKLWVIDNGKELKEAKKMDDWKMIPPNVAAAITSTGPMEAGGILTATAALFWNAVEGKLDYTEIGGPQQTTIVPGTELTLIPKQTDSAISQVSSEATTPISETTEKPTGTLQSSMQSISSPSSTQSTTPTISPKSNGLSGGAVAGVAIGCLLGGALIAGLLVWFCLKRRKTANSGRDSEARTVALLHREKGAVVNATSLSSGSPVTSALEHGLPQPLEDKAISGEISKISNLIKNHIQSYYHTRAVSAGMLDYDDLQALGENLPVSVGTLSTLLNSTATREIALRFSLAWVVISRIQLTDSPNTTFLPPEISGCLQSMDTADHSSRVHSLFFAKWRSITAELLQSTYVRNPFAVGDRRLQNIKAAATILDNILRPFADSRMDNAARSRNLEEILKRSAQFAFTLFSQPTTWDFDWQHEQSAKSGSLCIFPALVQVADENGESINPPRPFSEPVNRRLDD